MEKKMQKGERSKESAISATKLYKRSKRDVYKRQVLGSKLIADSGGVVLGGAVVHQDDLGVFPGGQKGLDTVAHIIR